MEMEMLLLPVPVPLSTDDEFNSESEQEPFDTTTTLLLLDGINNTANRCDVHDNRNRKNMVPFLESNYKYKRRLQLLPAEAAAMVSGTPQLNYSVTTPEQVEVERCRPLSDSFFEIVAVGFIVSSVVVFRDILLSFLRLVARDSWVWWCINSNKIHRRLSEMSGEVKRFASKSMRCRYGAVGWSKTFAIQYYSTSLKLIFLTLFIAIWMSVYEVEAGTCWMNRMDSGKCDTVYSKNMTKAQCCGKNQMFSFTEKNISNAEYFFVLALNGGTECVPCLESCKNVVCGPSKRCVKRKGRPKCICSPKCGSGKKHKKSHKKKQQQQQIHQQNGSLKSPHVIDVSRSKEQVSLVNYHSPITVRDVRSLSSEIHNNPSAVSAMVLTSPGDLISQSNNRRKNQRIPITTSPTKKQANLPVAHQHRLHHHHHHHQHQHHHHPHEKQQKQEQEQQQHHTSTVTKRRHANPERNKGDKLIITADDLVRASPQLDNDLANSNSLRDRSSTTGADIIADNHRPHLQQQQHGGHHFQKHAKPKRKISHQNGASHNFVHNATANRNKMKMAERRRHRTQSFDGLTTSFASSSLDQLFKQPKPTPLLYASNSGSNKNRVLRLRQDYTDDLAFEDKIHNGFFTNGFPYPHQELSTDESRYNHPVCGSDGRTYNTECQLKKRACRTDNTALVVAYRGHCQTSCKKVNCLNGLQCVEDHYAIPHCIVCSIECPIDDNAPQRIDPARAVCGVDGNTYKSTCDINRMVCKIGRSIAVAYQGPCHDDQTSCSTVSCGPKMMCLTDLLTHHPRCVSCKFKCSRKRRPANLRYEEGKLCGTNNRTYYSWCEMKKDSCQTGFYIDIKSIGECQQG